MNIFGSWKELVSLVFRKNSQLITLRPNQATTYTSARDAQLPPQDADSILVSENATQALTGKTIDGDLNTLQDIAISSLKTVLVDADKVILRDAAGAVVSAKIVDTNVATGAAISATKIADGSVDNTEFQRLNSAGTNGAGNLLTTDGTQTVTGKSIDGDDNTLSDIAITSLKTVLADANKVIRRDAAGAVVSDNTLPNSSAIVTIDATQDLTNKELTAPLIDDYADFNEETAPSTPGANKVRLYAKSDGKFYRKDDAGNESELGGSGSGEINVIDNPSDATNWAASGAGVTVATTTTAAELPLSGVIDSGIKVDPVSGTDYAYYRWTMPTGLQQRKLKVEWYQKKETGYTAGDLKVEVYKNAASNYGGAYTEFNLSTDSSGTSSIPAFDGKFTTTFDSDDGLYFELRIVRTAGTNFMVFSNLIVGPGVQPQGAVIDNPVSWTPTFGNLGTVTNNSAFYVRRGNLMKAWGTAKTGTTVAATCYLQLPTGLNLDTTTLVDHKVRMGTLNIGPGANVGSWTDGVGGAIIYDSGLASNRVGMIENITGASDSIWNASNGSTVFPNNSTFSWEFELSIAEWAGSGTVNLAQNDVEYAFNTSTTDASDTTSFGYGPQGTTVPTVTSGTNTGFRDKRVRFLTPIQPTDQIILEIASNNGDTFVPVGNSSDYNANTRQNSIQYGVACEGVAGSDTDMDVRFARGGSGPGATYGAAGASFPTNATDKWRLKKVKGGVAVGFGLAAAGSSGLIDYYQATQVTLDNEFTGGTLTVNVVRVGKVVTVSFVGTPTHASANTRQSTAGLIPTWARPTNSTYNLYYHTSASVARIGILSTGLVECMYRDWAGAGQANTDTLAPASITYVVA